MPVAEAMSRITEAEFEAWGHYFDLRGVMQERAQEGLDPLPPDDLDEADPAEAANRLHLLATMLNSGRA